jgi:hypothetical protein
MKYISVTHHVTTLNNRFKEGCTTVTLEAHTLLKGFNWSRKFSLPVPPPHTHTYFHLLLISHNILIYFNLFYFSAVSAKKLTPMFSFPSAEITRL